MRLGQVEGQLAAHIRNPEKKGGPEGMEPRRLKIYSDLFYNNIENFISSGFPVLRQLIDDDSWHAMVRDFMVQHRCQTPYFLEIGQEFLYYLQTGRDSVPGDLPFMVELAHYEWVELALDIADHDIPEIEAEPGGDMLEALPLLSPLAWLLAYQYPVHKIGRDFQPLQPGQPCYLIVYRNRQDQVGFMEANAVTARLLELLQTGGSLSGRQLLQQIAGEIQHPDPQQVVAGGLQILQQLLSLDIILGTVPVSS